MSLRHALLGLLNSGPRSGYELSKDFDEVLSKYAWKASHSHIYPELKKMSADGLVEVVEEGARGRRSYGITEEGHTELRRWMITPPQDAPMRNEGVLRLFLLSTLDPADARDLLDRMSVAARAGVEELSHVIQMLDEQPADPESEFGRYAAEFGLRIYTMQLEWAAWVRDRLDNAAG